MKSKIRSVLLLLLLLAAGGEVSEAQTDSTPTITTPAPGQQLPLHWPPTIPPKNPTVLPNKMEVINVPIGFAMPNSGSGRIGRHNASPSTAISTRAKCTVISEIGGSSQSPSGS